MGKISFAKFRQMTTDAGITSYTVKVRRDVSIGQETWKKLMNDKNTITTRTIAEICKLLDCQPGDIMEYIPDNEAGE